MKELEEGIEALDIAQERLSNYPMGSKKATKNEYTIIINRKVV